MYTWDKKPKKAGDAHRIADALSFFLGLPSSSPFSGFMDSVVPDQTPPSFVPGIDHGPLAFSKYGLKRKKQNKKIHSPLKFQGNVIEYFSIKNALGKKEAQDLRRVQVSDLGCGPESLVSPSEAPSLRSMVVQSFRNKDKSEWPLNVRKMKRHSVRKKCN